MAIIFSLPWALLMWSYVASLAFQTLYLVYVYEIPRMVVFFIALLLFCVTISNSLTRIFVAISSFLVVALVGGCIWTAWGSAENDQIWQISLSAFRRTRGVLSERVKGLDLFHTRRASDGGNITSTDRQGEVGV